MDLATEFDQAAGLRSLLKQSPPEVLAVIPFGASALPWLAHQAALRAALGQRVMAFDEWQISGSFSDCVGVSPRFDLAQAIEGLVKLEDCIVESAPMSLERRPHGNPLGVRVLSVARLAREFDRNRILQQRILGVLTALQSEADEWLWLARPCDLAGLSSFARAAPRFLFVVQPAERAITEAYAALKRLAKSADMFTVGFAMLGVSDETTRGMQTRFQRLAASQLGLEIHAVASVGEAIGLPEAVLDGSSAFQFAESLMLQIGKTAPVSKGWDRGWGSEKNV